MFVLVLFALHLVGLLFCGLGFLVMFPVSVLSHAILYRGFFPGGDLPAKPVLDVDTDFGTVGVAKRPGGRIPGWAWFAASAGLLVPVLVPIVVFGLGIALLVGLISSARRDFHHNDKAFQHAVRDFQVRAQEAAPAPGQPELPVQGNELRPNLGILQRPEIDSVKAALEGLRGNIFERQAALAWLIATKPVNLEPDRGNLASAVASLLSDPFVDVTAATALAIWATRDHVPILISALEHRDISVQRKAEEALRRLDDPRGLAALAEHEKRRNAHDSIPPFKRRPEVDLGVENAKAHGTTDGQRGSRRGDAEAHGASGPAITPEAGRSSTGASRPEPD